MTENDIWNYANQISSTIDNANENYTKEKIANKTNQNNLQIANLNNQADYERWKEQEVYNWAMWNATNVYNSPAHQRKLMEQAGYNPASLFGMNGAANATQMSIGDAPRTHDVQFQPWDFSLQSKYSNMAAMASTRKSNADAVNQEIKNVFEGSIKAAELAGMGYDNESKAVQSYVNQQTKGTQVDQQKANLASTQKDIELTDINLKRQQLEYQIAQVYGWERASREIEKLDKEIDLCESQKDLNEVLQKYYPQAGLASLRQAAASLWQAKNQEKQIEVQGFEAQTHRMEYNLNKNLLPYQQGVLFEQANKLLKEGKLTYEKYDLLSKFGKPQSVLQLSGAVVDQVNGILDFWKHRNPKDKKLNDAIGEMLIFTILKGL